MKKSFQEKAREKMEDIILVLISDLIDLAPKENKERLDRMLTMAYTERSIYRGN